MDNTRFTKLFATSNRARNPLAFALSLLLSVATITGASPSANAQIDLGISVAQTLFSAAAAAHRRHRQRVNASNNNNYGNAGYNSSTGEYTNDEEEQPETHHNGHYYSAGVSANEEAPAQPARENRSNRDIKMKNRAIACHNQGVDELNRKDYKRALNFFQQALNYDPTLVDAHWGTALAAKNLHDYERCLNESEIMLRKKPDKAEYWFTAGFACQHLHSFEKADRYYKRFLALAPNDGNSEYAHKAVEILEHAILKKDFGDYLADATSNRLARWARSVMPLKVYIEENTAVPGYKPEFAATLKDAFESWAEASQGKISFVFTNDKSEAAISCAWTADQSILGGTEELGLTHTSFTQDGRILEAHIDLYTLLSETELSKEEIIAKSTSVQLHEIGHALGLGHSQQVYDIMYYRTCPDGLETPLAARDTNTIIALYSLPQEKFEQNKESGQPNTDKSAVKSRSNSAGCSDE